MPRAERPLEQDGTILTEFAADLRKVRENAGGPSYRELARRAHYSSTTLSDAAGGRRLPSLEVTLAYVRACGGDVERWERRWRSVAAELTEPATGRSAADDESAPYVGLRPYGGGDADRFFGRERLTDDVLSRVAGRRFVAVFGPSGSGKSSLLRAGLVPRLASPVVVFTPGGHPLEECAIQLAAVTGSGPGAVREELGSEPRGLHRLVRQALVSEPPETEIVIVVDQFEELFTVCQDERERSAFITMLLTTASAADSRCRVVIGVRADFYQQCALHAELAEALQDAQITVGPMSADELRLVITEPARQAHCAVESALLTTLVAQTHGRTAVLPLLSHALLETWRRRKGNTLTLAGFQASGQFDGALAKTAEAAFATLDESQQDLAQDLFRRLTALGSGTEHTRRRIHTGELDEEPTLAQVVDRFTQVRLLTRGEDTVELAHEALIKAWPRLASWLADDREGQRVHRELTDATAAWRRHDHDPSVLLRGTRLAVVRDWVDHGGRPSTKEQELLNASIAADARERDGKRRVVRRQRRLLALLTVLLVLAVSVTVYAVRAQEQVARERNTAIALKALDDINSLARSAPGDAALLSLAAYRLAPSTPTRDSLIATAADQAVLGNDDGNPLTAQAAADGQTVLTSSTDDNMTQLYRVSNHQWAKRGTLRGGWSASAGGQVAATSDNEPTKAPKVRIWNVEQPQMPEEFAAIPVPARVGALSADGRFLVTLDVPAVPDGVGRTASAKLWNLDEPRKPRLLGPLSCDERPDLGQSFIFGTRFVGKEAILLHCLIDPGRATPPARSVRLWTISELDKPTRAGQLGVARPDPWGSNVIVDKRVGLTREARGLTRWNIEDLGQPQEVVTTIELKEALYAGAISSTANLVALADDDGSVAVRDLRELGSVLNTLALPGRVGSVHSLAFGPDGKTLIGTSISAVTVAWRWDLDPEAAATAVCARPHAPIAATQWDTYFPGVSYKHPCP
ncbi:helix-turn-helix domain-containing protein [Amycolatopsis sp. lyj-90]|uniref:nSTAND1 domain-containing NTPase n=1 Tax=Amycolatopsis sp. lyj-90 TaxID=2789285 RepID=UPI003979C034